MSALSYSVQAIFPLFLLMGLGYALRRLDFLDDGFIGSGTRLLFHVAMPVMLFLDLLATDVRQAFDWRLLLMSVGGTTVYLLLLCLIIPRFIKEKPSSTAFIVGSFRGNLLVLGVPLVLSLAGSEGTALLGMVLVAMAPYNTVSSVLVFSHADEKGKAGSGLVKKVLLNPLFLGCVAGVIGSLLGLTLPELLTKPLGYLSDLCMPLFLLTIGASIRIKGEGQGVRRAITASLLKVLVMPLIFVGISVAIGLRGAQLAVMLVIFGSPTAAATFAMAYQMGADHKLVSLISVFTNLFCIFTLFGFVFLLRYMGWL